MKRCANSYIFWCVLFAVPMQGAGIDIFSPALPQVTEYFATTAVQLTVGFYLIGYGVGQFFCGPLTDSYGRKKVLMIGFFLYIIASLCAAFAPNITVLLIMRILQGIAIAAPAVVNRAIFADIYDHDKLPLKMNWFTTSWAMGPVVAPFMGGYLTHYLGWHSTLAFLALYAVVMIILFLYIPETHPNAKPLSVKDISFHYSKMIKHPSFLGAVICIALIYGIILLFNVVTPFLLQHQLGLTPVDFGYIALLMGVGIFAGNFINAHLLKMNIPQHFIVSTVLLVGIISSLMMFILGAIGYFNVTLIALPSFILFLVCGLFLGNLYSVPIRLFKEHGGMAGGLMGASFLTLSGIIGALASLLPKDSIAPLALANLVTCVVALVIYWLLVRRVFTK